MKANEIRKLSGAELETKLMDLKKDLFNLRLQHATNQLDNPIRISWTTPSASRRLRRISPGSRPSSASSSSPAAKEEIEDGKQNFFP